MAEKAARVVGKKVDQVGDLVVQVALTAVVPVAVPAVRVAVAVVVRVNVLVNVILAYYDEVKRGAHDGIRIAPVFDHTILGLYKLCM